MKNKYKKLNNQEPLSFNFKLYVAIFSICSLFLGLSFFVWTLYPYTQMFKYIRGMEPALNGRPEMLIDSPSVFEPYTHVQATIRYRFLYNLFSEYKKGVLNVNDVPLIEFAIKKMDELANKNENFPARISLIAKMYDALADIVPQNKQQYDIIAESYYKKAIALSPNNYNQDAKFSYSLNLTNQGRVDEAVLLMRETVAYDTRPREPHYFLGLALFKQGKNSWTEALNELEYSFNNGFNPFTTLAKDIYTNLMSYFYYKNDVKNLIIVVDRLTLIDPEQRESYVKVSNFLKDYNRMPRIEFSN